MLFEPIVKQKVSVFAHIVNHSMEAIYVQNDSDSDVILPRNTRIGNIIEYEADGCFLASVNDCEIALKPAKKTKTTGWVRQAWKGVLAAAATTAVYQITTDSLNNVIQPNSTQLESKLSNWATGYGDQPTIKAFNKVVDDYPDLWIDHGNTANIPESEWMEIPLVNNWMELYKPGQARVYPVGQKDRKVIDSAFDKLHKQGRMEWTTESTPFTYPCFVVWKNLADGRKKGRVVVDIRALNKITLPDAYPVPSQSNILSAVSGALHISTVDCCSFFYHWLVKREHRYCLTVLSHRGQETFKVAVMGYRNSPAYVQQMIDRILRPFQTFARAYVDDIVIFSNSFEDHIKHLHQVFKTLTYYNICLAPEKSFLGYPSVALLGQRVDAFGLTTSADKLAAIARLAFLQTLHQLDHYLGLTGYLRQYVPYYAAVVRPLQQQKIALTQSPRHCLLKGDARKNAASRFGIDVPTPKELNAFHHLQSMFSKPSILVHFSPKRRLYIDMDASKEVGIGAYTYHAIVDPTTRNPPKQMTIQPILFLSRELTGPEAQYWPTELEISGLVWVVRKLRHLIEASESPVVIFTDHSATCQIARQTSLNTVSIEKSNLKLVRSSEYLQRFNLNIRYRSGLSNVIPDTLSRLPIINSCKTRLIERDQYN